MVTVTDSAKDLLQVFAHPTGTVLRLEPMGGETGDIALVTGEEQEADQVVERDGTDLLHVPAAVADALDGATIDAVETLEDRASALRRGGRTVEWLKVRRVIT